MMWLISMAEGDVGWLKCLCLTSKLDILRQPWLVFLKNHVLPAPNRHCGSSKRPVGRDKTETKNAESFQAVPEIGRKTTAKREKQPFKYQKMPSSHFRNDGNRAGFSCHKPRRNCPYRRKTLKHKKRGRMASSFFCPYPKIAPKRGKKKDTKAPPCLSATAAGSHATATFSSPRQSVGPAERIFYILS
ncbi:MAG: hypothetical protein ACI4V2_05625 [Alloprevotella sp.]